MPKEDGRAAHDPEGRLPPPPLPPQPHGERVFERVLLAVVIVFAALVMVFMAWALSSTGL
jgi:hypothetical protein